MGDGPWSVDGAVQYPQQVGVTVCVETTVGIQSLWIIHCRLVPQIDCRSRVCGRAQRRRGWQQGRPGRTEGPTLHTAARARARERGSTRATHGPGRSPHAPASALRPRLRRTEDFSTSTRASDRALRERHRRFETSLAIDPPAGQQRRWRSLARPTGIEGWMPAWTPVDRNRPAQ
jgi:hypothetical protein